MIDGLCPAAALAAVPRLCGRRRLLDHRVLWLHVGLAVHLRDAVAPADAAGRAVLPAADAGRGGRQSGRQSRRRDGCRCQTALRIANGLGILGAALFALADAAAMSCRWRRWWRRSACSWWGPAWPAHSRWRGRSASTRRRSGRRPACMGSSRWATECCAPWWWKPGIPGAVYPVATSCWDRRCWGRRRCRWRCGRSGADG